ncbi:HupE/UreJ family protein [Glaciecola sp. MF2-115]|uniref:HupE/UreJ family protein n=1 Tax=Glaciecola sp. MF2-115 TaxID=3384827 RepID=UPI0039A0BEC5
MIKSVMVLSFLLLFSSSLNAHELSTTYVSIGVDQEHKLDGEVKLDILDLKEVLNLDLDLDGQLTWGEIESSTNRVQAYVSSGMSLIMGDSPCALNFDANIALQELNGVSYLVLPFTSQCDDLSTLRISYSLLFEAAANHKAIFRVQLEQEEHVFIMDDKNTQHSINLDLNESSIFFTFMTFIYQGIFHILIGLDHILFLFTLLLTVCLYREKGEWKGIESSRTIIKKTLWIVTSFTLAHSITLSGTALGLIPTMGSWIEVVIAASILFNVVNNIFPFIHKLSLITFVFGLIHGMGFAGALSELGLSDQHQLLSVVAFNLGVELGQIAILLLLLPILLKLRKNKHYCWYGVQFLSVVVGGLAVYWILDRW